MKESRLTIARLGLIYAAYFGSLAVIFPFLPIYLRLRGLPPSRIGLVLAAIEAAGVVAPFVLSRLADRTGKYRLIMGFMVVSAGASLFFLHRSVVFPAMLLFAAFQGFFSKPMVGMADALSGRVLEDPTRNYGLARLWGTVSFVAVSIVLQSTGLMETDDPVKYITYFLVAMAVLLAAVPLTAPAPADGDADEAGTAGGLRGMPPGYWSMLALAFVGNLGFAIHQSFGSLYYSEVLGVSAVSSLFALAAASEIPSLFFGGRILGRLGHRKMLFIALAAAVIRMVTLALFPSAVPIYLSQVTHALMFGFYLVSGVNWVNRSVSPSNRALGMGLFIAIGFGGAQLAGSAFGGFLVEHGGFPLLFGIGAFFPLSAMVWLASDKRIGTVGSGTRR